MDNIQLPGRIAPLAIASVAIFLLLLAVSGLFRGVADHKSTPQQHYDKLAQVLHSEGLLPPVRSDVYIMALAQHALNPEQINYPHGVIAMGSTIGLEAVIIGAVNNTEVYQVEVIPGEYKRLRPGNLRNALREFYRKKQNQLLPEKNGQPVSISQPVEFFVAMGGSFYRIQPVFQSGRCVRLLITQ